MRSYFSPTLAVPPPTLLTFFFSASSSGCAPEILRGRTDACPGCRVPAGCLNVTHISQGRHPDGRGPIPTPPGGKPAQSCGPHDPIQQDQVPGTVTAYAREGRGGLWLQGGTPGYGSRTRLSVAARKCFPGHVSPGR